MQSTSLTGIYQCRCHPLGRSPGHSWPGRAPPGAREMGLCRTGSGSQQLPSTRSRTRDRLQGERQEQDQPTILFQPALCNKEPAPLHSSPGLLRLALLHKMKNNKHSPLLLRVESFIQAMPRTTSSCILECDSSTDQSSWCSCYQHRRSAGTL